MTEQTQQPEPPASPSPSTSGPEVDRAADPGRVGPVKLAGTAPEPISERKPERVGPVKLDGKSPAPPSQES